MSKKNSVLTSLACILGIPALAIMLMFYCIARGRSSPKYFPDDWGAYVWVSEEPKAFITSGYRMFLGGQMEIDGEIQTIDVETEYNHDIIAYINTIYFVPGTNHYKSTNSYSQYAFGGDTKYKPDCIICKISRKSERLPGQKIVFTKYAKDEVSPADFGFEIENWDDFVITVDSLGDEEWEERSKQTPCPATTEPESYPIQTPVPISTPTPMPDFPNASDGVLSARARPKAAQKRTAMMKTIMAVLLAFEGNKTVGNSKNQVSLFGRKSCRMGLNMSSRIPASRQVQPWGTPSFFSRVSPAVTSRVSPSMVKEKRPLTT